MAEDEFPGPVRRLDQLAWQLSLHGPSSKHEALNPRASILTRSPFHMMCVCVCVCSGSNWQACPVVEAACKYSTDLQSYKMLRRKTDAGQRLFMMTYMSRLESHWSWGLIQHREVEQAQASAKEASCGAASMLGLLNYSMLSRLQHAQVSMDCNTMSREPCVTSDTSV